MKNVFSYPYGTVFTGKEIKEFLLAWQKKGNSLYRMKQFLNCKDDRLYEMSYDTTPSGENPVKYRTFVRKKTYQQIKYERDIAIQQLKELGYSLGEKIRTDEYCISREELLLYLDALKESEPKHYGFILSLQKYLRELSSVKPKADVDALINKMETELSSSMYDD